LCSQWRHVASCHGGWGGWRQCIDCYVCL